MRKIITSCAVAIVLLIATGCGSSETTSPTVRSNPPAVTVTPPPPPPPSSFPPPTGPARIFVYDHSLWDHPQAYTTQSRFVLYDNHAFALQYPGIGDYRGEYTDLASGGIDFAWEGWSSAGPWGATGTFRGDTLTVQYNIVMSLSDFEDAVYILMR